MKNCGVEMPHYCGQKTCATNVSPGPDAEYFCHKPHPDTTYNEDLDSDVPLAHCRRQPGHDGDCAAYTFAITSITEWASA